MSTSPAEDLRPIIELARNNAGNLFVGGTDLDERGYGLRAYVLVGASGDYVAERVIERRFFDLVRLMGDNVQYREGHECEACGNVVVPKFDETGQRGFAWAEVNWGDDRDFQCGLSDDGRHHGAQKYVDMNNDGRDA